MTHKTLFAALLITLLLTPHAPLIAQENTQFPRAASLKRSEVYVRSGPGTRYPILWVFQRKGWPVTLLAKYDNWFKIKDIEGEEGWVYLGMVSGENTGLISPGTPVTLARKPDGTSPIFRLSANVLVDIEDCPQVASQEMATCRITYNNKTGFIPPARLLQP